jgi:thiol:disulfide interchange protein DsbD
MGYHRGIVTSLSRVLCALTALVLAPAIAAGSPHPQGRLGDSVVAARLILDRTPLAPGRTTVARIELTPAAGWHLYGPEHGDAGVPPDVAWTLPRGLRAGAIAFPPARRVVARGLTTYDYDRRTALRVRISAATGAPARRYARVVANVTWVACSNVCAPGGVSLRGALTIAR